MTLETSVMVQVGLWQQRHPFVILILLCPSRSLYETEAYAHGTQHGGELRLVQQNGHCGKYALGHLEGDKDMKNSLVVIETSESIRISNDTIPLGRVYQLSSACYS